MTLTKEEYHDWLSFLLPDDSGVIAVLKCTVDESGTHGNAQVPCVAGCVATGRQWRLFANEWRPLIAGLPKGYHAKRGDCAVLNCELADLMWRRLDHTRAITIIESEYRAYAPAKFRSIIGSAYAVAVQALIYRMARWCDEKKINHVAYVLEVGHKSQKQVDRTFRNVMASPVLRQRNHMWSYTWASKSDITLHPADLLSHELATFGPLGEMLWKRSKQEHIGREEIEQIADVVLRDVALAKSQGRKVPR